MIIATVCYITIETKKAKIHQIPEMPKAIVMSAVYSLAETNTCIFYAHFYCMFRYFVSILKIAKNKGELEN